MIQRKKKICKECGKEMYLFSRGRCKFCATKTYTKPKQISDKQKKVKKVQSDIRSIYFETLISLCKKSEQSGKTITEPSRINVCHIFPKRRYKSVQANLDNYVYLTADEHTRFDYLLDTLDFETLEKEFENCWQIILKRVKKLLPLIKETGKLKLKFEEYV